MVNTAQAQSTSTPYRVTLTDPSGHQWFADEDRRGCTNRSWADLSSLIKGDSNEALKSASYRTAIRGTVGNAAGQAFISSLDDMKDYLCARRVVSILDNYLEYLEYTQ